MADFRITAAASGTSEKGWTAVLQFPSFVLEGDVLGILDRNQAEDCVVRWIRRIIDHVKEYPSEINVSATASRIE